MYETCGNYNDQSQIENKQPPDTDTMASGTTSEVIVVLSHSLTAFEHSMNILNALENIIELAKPFTCSMPCSSSYANSNFRRLTGEINHRIPLVSSSDGQRDINTASRTRGRTSLTTNPLRKIQLIAYGADATIAQNLSIFNYLHLINFSIICTYLIHEYVNFN